MGEFLAALPETTFLQTALVAGALAGVACGVVGAFVVARRITYVAGGIAHCVLGGMGAAVYLQKVHGVTWAEPLLGATVAALGAALVIGLVSLRLHQREDTVISALWAVGMAVGVLFLARTPGYQQDLTSYLFGNILMVSRRDLLLIAGLDVLVMGVALGLYNQLAAVCFDEEYARTRGLRVELYYLLLLGLTALTVVLLVSVVGIVMVIALLTLPAAVAGIFARRLWQVMIGAAGLSVLLTSGGLALSYGPDLPSGAVIILLAAGVYLAALAGRSLGQRLRSGLGDGSTTESPSCPTGGGGSP